MPERDVSGNGGTEVSIEEPSSAGAELESDAHSDRPSESDPNSAALSDKGLESAGGIEAPGDDLLEMAEASEATEETSAEQETESLRAEVAALQDRLLRTAAEFQNYRRRTQDERQMSLQAGRAQAVESLLDVFDDLRRSLEAAESVDTESESAPSINSMRDGVRLVYEKFAERMRRLGVEPIEAVGQPFDEHLHDALMSQPASEDTEPGVVVAEIQRGYKMGDRVLRHAQVVVAA